MSSPSSNPNDSPKPKRRTRRSKRDRQASTHDAAVVSRSFFSAAAQHLRQLDRDSTSSLLPRHRPTEPRPPERRPLPDDRRYPPSRWRRVIAEERLRRHWEAYLLDYTPDGRPRPDAERERLREVEKEKIATDLVYWVERYLWLEDPQSESPTDRTFPVVLWPKQREFINWLVEGYREGRPRTALKGRKLGASWLAVAIVYHFWDNEPGFKALLGCFDEKRVDDGTTDSLLGKFRYIWDTQPTWLRPDVRDREHSKHLQIQHPDNGSVITGGAASTRFGRGARASIVLTDEWAHYETQIQDQIKLSLETVARSWWQISTPKGRGEDFHYSYVYAEQAGGRDCFKMIWTADPRRTRKWYRSLLRKHGGKLSYDEREQEHNGNFAAVLGERVFRATRDKIAYSDDNLPDGVRMLPVIGAMDFGSGPSLTVAGFAFVEFTEEADKPNIWIDRVLAWQRVPAEIIASNILDALTDYPPFAHLVGDPAGIQADAEQESWESRLQAYGVPLSCLDAKYNMDFFIGDTINDTQTALDEGRLRFHEDRALLAIEAVESWQWDLPNSVPLDFVRKSEIKPRKDKWSHPGDMIRYLVGYVIREGLSREYGIQTPIGNRLPVGESVSVARTYDSIFGRSGGGVRVGFGPPMGAFDSGDGDGEGGYRDGRGEQSLDEYTLDQMTDFSLPIF